MRVPHPNPSWTRRGRGWFTERLLLKGSAILLAVMLWFLVSAREPTEDVVVVRFEPGVDSALQLAEAPPAIRAWVLGPSHELLKLYSSPPVIRRPVEGRRPGTRTVDLQVNDVEIPSGIDAVVEDVRPRTLSLRLVRRTPTP